MKPIALQTAATIQKRRMIFVSDHALELEVVVDRRHQEDALAERLEVETWIRTESASITKMPPITISSTSVFVITAKAAIARTRGWS